VCVGAGIQELPDSLGEVIRIDVARAELTHQLLVDQDLISKGDRSALARKIIGAVKGVSHGCVLFDTHNEFRFTAVSPSGDEPSPVHIPQRS
jgi:hypothetical protein